MIHRLAKLVIIALLTPTALWAGPVVIHSFSDLEAARPAIAQAEDPVLALIKQLAPEFRLNYALAYDSGSNQIGDTKHPRAILSKFDGSLVVAFLGDRTHPESNYVEVMRRNADKFEFFHIDLKDPQAPLEANPELCKSCHGEDPLPVWDRYPSWHGMYGSDDDVVSDVMGERRKPEFKAYMEDYLKIGALEPRYAQLQRIQGTPTSPFAYDVYKGTSAFRPNLRIGQAMSIQLAQRLVERVARHPDFTKYAPAFMFDLFACGRMIQENDIEFESYVTMNKLLSAATATPSTQIRYFNNYSKLLGFSARDINLEDPNGNLESFREREGYWDGSDNFEMRFQTQFAKYAREQHLLGTDLSWLHLKTMGDRYEDYAEEAKDTGETSFDTYYDITIANDIYGGEEYRKFCVDMLGRSLKNLQ